MNVSPFSIRLVDGLARSPTQALPQIKRIQLDFGSKDFGEGIAARKPPVRCKNDPRCAHMASPAPRILQIDRDAFISSASSHELGRICMISMYSQSAPSRSVLMLDAGLAR
jgi:hypothetical protein